MYEKSGSKRCLPLCCVLKNKHLSMLLNDTKLLPVALLNGRLRNRLIGTVGDIFGVCADKDAGSMPYAEV